MRTSTKAWIVLGAGVAAYEAFCPLGETLSEGIDNFVDRPIGKAIVGAIGAITVAHLCNVCPEQIDIYTKLGNLKERVRNE